MQKEPKTKTQSFNPLFFCLSARLCESGFRKQCRLHEVPLRQSVYLRERSPFRKTKKYALLMSLKRILQAWQVMIRHPKGENTTSLSFHSPLIIPRVPVTFAKIKCGRGSAKDFTSLQDSRTRSYEEMFFKKCTK